MKSVGVLVAEKVCKTMKINDTIWVTDLITLADEIDSALDFAIRQGAIEELKKELDWILHAPFTNLNTKGMLEKRIRNRLKELMK